LFWWALTHAPADVFERSDAMFEPIIGLCVAVLLGVYLVYTLLHPEKF
jgi:K+-transporting ATPase KdpF subunit